MASNPYQPTSVLEPVSQGNGPDQLAARSTRFVAALVDGVIFLVAYFVAQFLFFLLMPIRLDQTVVLAIISTATVIGVQLALNGYLLITRGQSIGKLLFGTQIVSAKNGRLLPFVQVILIRTFWTVPFSLALAILNAQVLYFVFGLVVLVGILLIFGKNIRCLHDYLAGSNVVLYRDNRGRA